jgi:hypothetical protein
MLFVVISMSCTVATPIEKGSQLRGATVAKSKRHFEHVIIVFLENQNYDKVRNYILEARKEAEKNKDSEKYKGLSKILDEGAEFTQFRALFHPSQFNYLAMISGKTSLEFQQDKKNSYKKGDAAVDISSKTIGDLLEKEHLTWKNYAENYPGTPQQYYEGNKNYPDKHNYVRKHVPFISFCKNNPLLQSHIVRAEEFIIDINNNKLPNYSFYSPDMQNDGHDSGLKYPWDNFIPKFLANLTSNKELMNKTLVVITYDESALLNSKNPIYTVFLGGNVKPGKVSGEYNHYNVLRTIEENFGLEPLADGDRQAKPITGIWKDE